MKIFYDAEFIERGPGYPIQLVSIGMAREDGSTLYAVSDSFDIDYLANHPWLSANVLPHIPNVVEDGVYWIDTGHRDVRSRDQIAEMVAEFVLGVRVPDPELWASYCAYDHVVLCQLFGRMVDLPAGFPMFTNDIKSYSVRLGDPEWPKQEEGEHHALEDARHAHKVWKFLRGIEMGATIQERRVMGV